MLQVGSKYTTEGQKGRQRQGQSPRGTGTEHTKRQERLRRWIDRGMQSREGKTHSWLWDVKPPTLWLQLLPRQMDRLSAPMEASACHAERHTIPLSRSCDNLNLAE